MLDIISSLHDLMRGVQMPAHNVYWLFYQNVLRALVNKTG